MREPAEVFPVWDFINDEMTCRGWTKRDLSRRMGGSEDNWINLNLCTLDLIEHVREPNAHLGMSAAIGIGRAFGTSPEIWLNLDKMWRDHQQESP